MRLKAILCFVLGTALNYGHVFAQRRANIDWIAYEHGHMGVNPQVKFNSVTATAPLIHLTMSSSECESESYIFMTPRGENVRGNKAMIIDNRGELVWYQQERGAVSNFRV